jgi:hypothetical protein
MVTKAALYVSDDPIAQASQDRFGREHFARGVAKTIASRSDPSSLTIGIYGLWGSGKTSVLNMIYEDLSSVPEIAILRFNPWRYGTEDELLADFFRSLADVIGRTLDTNKERLGRRLKQYAPFFTPLATGASIFVRGVSATGLKELAEKMSEVSVDELRERLDVLLRTEGFRIVVLMDDIDRLDKSEIQSVFRLVKLTADFSYTTYVLTFDDELVASALQEKYANSSRDAGRGFLEKIIQVPLHLPHISHSALSDYCMECVQQALSDTGTTLSKDQESIYRMYLRASLEPRLRTPRMCKRYGNALAFALAILEGEVEPVDLMLIEGIRISYPHQYEVIRANRDVFLGNTFDPMLPSNELETGRKAEVSRSLGSGLTEVEVSSIRYLLGFLFPNFARSGGEMIRVWNANQRICSPHYFDRYFTYSVPAQDVPDKDLDALHLLSAENSHNPIQESAELLAELASRYGGDVLLRRLEMKQGLLTSGHSFILTMAFLQVVTLFKNPQFEGRKAFSSLALTLRQLVLNRAQGSGREELAKLVISRAEPLSLAYECLELFENPPSGVVQFSSSDSDQDATDVRTRNRQLDRLVSDKTFEILHRIFEARVTELVMEPGFWDSPSEVGNELLRAACSPSKGEAGEALWRAVSQDPYRALVLLRWFYPSNYDENAHSSYASRLEDVVNVADLNSVLNQIVEDKSQRAITLTERHGRLIRAFQKEFRQPIEAANSAKRS